MTPVRARKRHGALVAVSVLGLVMLSLFAKLLGQLRPDTEALFSNVRLRVTSPRDGGTGSLREALFAAGKSEGRPIIVCEVERVVLETPLPPLSNAEGIVLTAPQDSMCEIDARAAGGEPVLNVAAPSSVLSRLRVRGAAVAVLVRDAGVRLEDVEIVDSAQGVIAVDGARELTIARALFAGNDVGLRVEPSSGRVRIRESRFIDHEEAGVWAVARAPIEGLTTEPRLVVRESRFERNLIGVVTIHTSAYIERNEFTGSGQAAVYLTGEHAVLRGNRIRNGAAYGLFADAAEGAVIEDNELDRNGAVGALVRYGASSVLRGNRVYSNPYGIVVVLGEPARPDRIVDNFVFDHSKDGLFLLGSSPILRDNEILDNRDAGIRVLDFVSAQAGLVTARPLLEDNVVRGNGLETIRGEFRLEDEGRPVESEPNR